MSARGWVERLAGARASSATQQPPSRARPGAADPARSGSPERIPVPPPGPRPRPPVPDPKGTTLRVVLVSRDNMLAGALRSLVEAPGGVRVLDWYSDELDAAIRHADVVIVDTPPNLHEHTLAVIAGRFLGRTVVLLQEGEHAEALPPDPPRAVLYRPVQIGELWMAVTGATPPVPDPAPEPQAAEAAVGEAPAAEEAEAEVPAAARAEPEVDDQVPAHEEEVEATDGAAAGPQGLPVAESGRLIGLSGQELDPVIGPGEVAAGMDKATLERPRGWRSQAQEPATDPTGPAPATPSTGGREEARRTKAERAEARKVARTEARQATQERAKAEARRVARAETRQARAAAALVRRERSRQARALRAAAWEQWRAEAGEARAARVAARKAARAQARQARATQVGARKVARVEAGRAAGARVEAAARGWVGWVIRPALIVLVMAVGLAAAGWRGGGAGHAGG